MTNWCNYHTHSHYDDGARPLHEYAAMAKERGMKILGFSGHSPVPFLSDWNMSEQNYLVYKQEVAQLKKEYEGELEILMGLETDFIDGVCGPSTFAHELDYTIGSVHYLAPKPDGTFWSFDFTTKDFSEGLEMYFGNDIRRMATFYYDQVARMVEQDAPDVIGHLDLIKKFNEKRAHFFDETEKWYQKKALSVIDLIAVKGCIVEINTRGVFKQLNAEFYPSKWLLKECRKRNIPVMINADAHNPKEVDSLFTQAAAMCSMPVIRISPYSLSKAEKKCN